MFRQPSLFSGKYFVYLLGVAEGWNYREEHRNIGTYFKKVLSR
jgi:hypothetical protein